MQWNFPPCTLSQGQSCFSPGLSHYIIPSEVYGATDLFSLPKRDGGLDQLHRQLHRIFQNVQNPGVHG